jgi:hypothetical protein
VRRYSATVNFNLEDAVEVFTRTPATINTLLGGLSEPWIRASEGEKTFSPFDVVGHLIDADETNWLPRARVILDAGSGFAPFDRFRHQTRNAGRSLESLLAEFSSLRAANLETLNTWQLTRDDLERTGTHPEFGAVTMKQLLSTWVAHDLSHIAQIVRVMAKRYASDVGPWAAFLPILKDREAR